jgi:hypothetical protein
MEDHCNGTIKKINTVTKAINYLNIPAGYLSQRIFVSPEIIDHFFYLAILQQDPSAGFMLFSYNLKSHATSLIKDGLTGNPTLTRYLLSGKNLAISGNPVEVINLETGDSELIPVYGAVKTFSPDGNKLILYSLQYMSGQVQVTGALEYDFLCHCSSPLVANFYPEGVIWNNIGLYGYNRFYDNPYNFPPLHLELTDFNSGDVLDTFTNFVGGLWSAYAGTKLLAFTFQESDSGSARLNAFDCVTHTSMQVLSAESSSQYDVMGINEVSVTTDQSKIAYTEQSVRIKVSPL